MEVDSARSGPPPQGPRSFSPIIGGAQGHGWDPEQLELVGEGALSPRQGMGEHKVPSNATTRRFHSSTMAKVPSDPNHTAIPRRAPPAPLTCERLPQRSAEDLQLLLADAAPRPQQPGDETDGGGDLGQHVGPRGGPAALAHGW